MSKVFCLSALSILATTLSIIIGDTFADNRKVYIVYMGALPERKYSPSANHQTILRQVLEDSLPSESLIHSYGKSFNGFAAKLTQKERQKLSRMEGIVSVFPSRNLELHTTRSWDFMGFHESVERTPSMESDIIVGVIDSGVWHESESFNDEGFSPPPKKWGGSCNGGKNYTCNNKLIGARYYPATHSKASARDEIGHGTHTASTVAGNKVNDVSFYGLAQGNARGGVPSARIASYKVCWPETACEDKDILAAFDDAISDGVDIISISIGGMFALQYSRDVIAIGAFHAMQKGILTTASAGNRGPYLRTVVNVAPWSLIVAASTIDRRIVNKITLGGDTVIEGTAVNAFDMEGKKFPLLYEGISIKGKINVETYTREEDLAFIQKAAGVIKIEDRFTDFAQVCSLPACLVDVGKKTMIVSYVNSTKNPEASISRSMEVKEASAPRIISFSSRGPNPITSDILKPDITAPGVEILAGWSNGVSPSKVEGDLRHVKYNILSGTSMSCPHATAAAAYVKSFHSDWSPSAIKSALMTTASSLNAVENPNREYDYGAGHIDPLKAVDPGLVYDAVADDYITMLCSIGYTTNKIKLMAGSSSSCPTGFRGTAKDLNYPSMASSDEKANFTRTVTNVGAANSTYTATITSPPNLNVVVDPNTLSFKSVNEKKSFVVKVSITERPDTATISASLVWSDGVHNVRSPIVFYNGF